MPTGLCATQGLPYARQADGRWQIQPELMLKPNSPGGFRKNTTPKPSRSLFSLLSRLTMLHKKNELLSKTQTVNHEAFDTHPAQNTRVKARTRLSCTNEHADKQISSLVP